MFYEKYLELCDSSGLSPSAAAEKIGFTKAANTKWADGRQPRPATLAKIAAFFNVPTDYFASGETTGKEKAPTLEEPSVEAMYIAELVNDLPAEKRKQVVSYLLELRKTEDG